MADKKPKARGFSAVTAAATSQGKKAKGKAPTSTGFLETTTEQHDACLALIKRFRKVEDVLPTMERAIAAAKQAANKAPVNGDKPVNGVTHTATFEDSMQ